eukprot:1368554-Rhodomonas_salina.2
MHGQLTRGTVCSTIEACLSQNDKVQYQTNPTLQNHPLSGYKAYGGQGCVYLISQCSGGQGGLAGLPRLHTRRVLCTAHRNLLAEHQASSGKGSQARSGREHNNKKKQGKQQQKKLRERRKAPADA